MAARYFFVLLTAFCVVTVQAASSGSRVTETPDFLQTDRKAGFSTKGELYCAPAAVSNSLMWLSAHGYVNLASEAADRHDAQAEMIRTLAGSDYMNTNPAIGTDVPQLLRGIRRYVEEAGYSIGELYYEGWRPVPADAAQGDYPALEDIRAAIDDERGAVWLNVGWYRYDDDSGEYARRGGHWVTVAGYEGDDLLIHDPSPAAGSGFSTQRITLTEITEGTLTGNQRNLPRSASGYYEVGGEMRKGNSTCLLDGAVFMTLE